MKNEIENGSTVKREWKPLANMFTASSAFFEKTLFLEGFDISSNVYGIRGDYITIIDPGNDYTAFMDLFDRGLKPSDIKKIVLTHGHIEHAVGTFELMGYPSLGKNSGLEVIIHETGPDGFKEMIEKSGCPLTVTEVSGGETLNLGGFELEVIHTPGHTVDSICLYHAPTRSLITGDTVLPYAVASPDPAAGGRLEYHLFTLKRILAMAVDNLLPGHGLPIESAAQQVINGSYTGVIRRMVGTDTPWIEGAAILAKKGYLEETIFCCDKELEVNEKNMSALELKASCLNDLGRFDEAIQIFDTIRRYDRNHGFAALGKGYAMMGLGKYDESLKYFDLALTYTPNVGGALLYKGMALYLSGRIEEAMDIEDFQVEFVDKFRDWLSKHKDPSPDRKSRYPDD